MKKYLNTLIAISVLGINGGFNIANTQFLSQKIITLNVKETYEKILPWEFFKQEGPNYCTVASIQELVYYFTGEKISQVEIAKKAKWGPDGVTPYDAWETINYYLQGKKPNKPFFRTHLRSNFANGSDEDINKDLIFFQNFIKSAISEDTPIIFAFAGLIPWSDTMTIGHAVNIIGINIENDNPGDTEYIVSETAWGRKTYFTGEFLASMLPKGGTLISTIKGEEPKPDPFSLNLNVPIVSEAVRKYRSSAAIKSIFNFYNKGATISQIDIYNQFNDINSHYGELVFNDTLAKYISDVTEKSYIYSEITENFGNSIEDRQKFQNYVIDSIEKEIPLIFEYSRWVPNNHEEFIGHTVIISGIEVMDDNPNHTRYYISDTDGYGTRWNFLGKQLKTFTASHCKGIIGLNKLSDF